MSKEEELAEIAREIQSQQAQIEGAQERLVELHQRRELLSAPAWMVVFFPVDGSIVKVTHMTFADKGEVVCGVEYAWVNGHVRLLVKDTGDRLMLHFGNVRVIGDVIFAVCKDETEANDFAQALVAAFGIIKDPEEIHVEDPEEG